MKIVLSKPFTYTVYKQIKGEAPEQTECTINEIDLNFESLTGRDMLEAHKESSKSGYKVEVVPAWSMAFQAVIISRLTRIPFENILQMNARDFTKATVETQNFLLNMDTKE